MPQPPAAVAQRLKVRRAAPRCAASALSACVVRRCRPAAAGSGGPCVAVESMSSGRLAAAVAQRLQGSCQWRWLQLAAQECRRACGGRACSGGDLLWSTQIQKGRVLGSPS